MTTSISANHSYAGDSLSLGEAHDATAMEFHRISPASGLLGPIRGFLNVSDGLDDDQGDGLPVRPLPSQGDGHNNNPILIGIVLGWAVCKILDGVNDAVRDAMKPKAAPPPPAPAPTPPPPAPTNGSGPTTVFV